jgi:hypothetical protein
MINISAGDQQRIDDYVARFEQMNDAEARARHEEIIAKTEAEYAEFVRAFNEGDCYLCHHPIASFSTQRPCLHWLLKPKGFKKKHIVEVVNHYDFFQLQSYLRWVANRRFIASIEPTSLASRSKSSPSAASRNLKRTRWARAFSYSASICTQASCKK